MSTLKILEGNKDCHDDDSVAINRRIDINRARFMKASTAEVLDNYKERHRGDGYWGIVAAHLEVKYSTLMRKINQNEDRRNLFVEELPVFIEATGFDFTLLDHIESFLGRVAISITPNSGGALDMEGLRRFAKESGEALYELSKSLDDGKVDRSEAGRCLKELNELARVCMTLVALCHKAIDEQR